MHSGRRGERGASGGWAGGRIYRLTNNILETKKRRRLWFIGRLWFLAVVSRGWGFCVVSFVHMGKAKSCIFVHLVGRSRSQRCVLVMENVYLDRRMQFGDKSAVEGFRRGPSVCQACCEFFQCDVPRSTVPFPMAPLTSVCGVIEDGKLFFTHDSHYASWLRPHRSVSTTLHFRD